MELKELIIAVQELINTKTHEEMIEVLQRCPELLNKENIDKFRKAAMNASLSSDEQAASSLEKTAEYLTKLSKSISGTGKVNPPPVSQTTVTWARLAREYLTLRKKELLEQAIVSAEQAGENEIASLLRARQENNIPVFDEHASSLYQKLLSTGKREETLTVALFQLDIRAHLAEYSNHFPQEEQDQALEIGIQACQESVSIADMLGDEACKAFYLDMAGNGYVRGRRLDSAEAAYQEALTIRRKLAEKEPQVYELDVGMTLNNLGNVLSNMHRLDSAESAYKESLKLYRKLAEKEPQVYEPDIATTLNNLGNVLHEMRHLDSAESAYKESLKLYRKLAEKQPQVATTFNNLGNVLHEMHHLDSAESAYKEALTIRRKLAEEQPQVYEPGVAGTLNDLGNVLREMRHLDSAESAFQESLKLYRKLAEKQPQVYEPNVAMTLNNLGHVLREMRHLDSAELAFQEALKLYRKLAEKQPQVYESGLAGTLNNLGHVLSNMRHLDFAESAYKESLKLYRKLAEKQPQVYEQGVAGTLNDLGNVFREMRRLDSAESAYQEALTIKRKLSQKQPQVYEPDVAMILNNLGVVFRNMRHLDSAESAYKESLKLYRILAEKQPQVYESYVAGTFNNLGNLLSDMHRPDSAESAFQEVLKLFRKLAEKQPQVHEPDIAMTLNNLGKVLSEMRHFDSAESAFQDALQLYRRLAEKEPQVYEPDVAMTLNNLGNVLREMRHLDSAESAYKEALRFYRTYDIPDQMAGTLSSLSSMWMEKELWEDAAELLGEAKEKVERLRVETLSLDRQMQIFREHFQIYEKLLVCLMKLGRIKDALVVAEAGKSRTLADLLALRHMMPHNVTGELAEEYNRILIQTRKLEYQIEQGGVNTSRVEFVKTHRHLQELIEDIRRADPDFMPYIQPPDIQEIQSLAKEAQSTLVLFRVTEQGSFVFLVFPDGSIDSIEVPEFTARTLDDMLVTFKNENTEDGWLVRYYAYREAEGIDKEKARQVWLDTMDTTLGKLYEQFLKYIHQRLKGITDSLVFIPNRGLSILPLHACWWKENGTRKYLMDEFFIRFAPSLSVFKRCLERKKTGRNQNMLLGAANPDPPGNLVYSEWECKEIESMLGDERCLILWNDKATKKELMQQVVARPWEWLHFSCHGQYRPDAPLESAIYFADEALTLGEIFEGMYLPEAWLVVLSACETGLVDYRDIADEHFGLPAGFLYAGAATVFSSLWMVNDLSTALLMRKIYEELVKGIGNETDGLLKAHSLNKAQRWLRDITAGELIEILSRVENELGRPGKEANRMTWAQIAPKTREMMYVFNPDDRPFEHPFWWAGFQHTGV